MKKLAGYQKGVNLGGWLSQGKLDKEHLDTFITEKDIAVIASWGCDHVRLPVDFENVENPDGSENAAGYGYIDSCVAWCEKYNLNVVLDLHKTLGYIFDDADYSADFFDNAELQDRFLNLWDKLSARYAKHSDRMMFEMLNEVVRFDVADVWNELALRCITVIRKNAPTVRILFGGVGCSAVSAVKYLADPVDENIVYNIHCYEPMVFTHQTAQWVQGMPSDFHIAYPGSVEKYNEAMKRICGAREGVFHDTDAKVTELGTPFFEKLFQEAVAVCESKNVPLYCGEYGVIDQAPIADTLRWYRDIHDVFEKFGIGRAAWSYKQMDFGLSDDRLKAVLPQLTELL
ncbi:MAG: glycoside hydrolase family 5 protein [Faecousia sp.]